MTNHVASCEKCNKNRTAMPKNAKAGEMQPVTVGDAWERIGIDILGPLTPTKKHRYKYILVVICYASKFAFAIPLRKIDGWTVGRALVEKVFLHFGVPRVITSDRGQPFIGKLQQALLKLLGATPAFTTPYHPPANGLAENIIKALTSMIMNYVNEYSHDDWDIQLPYILFAHRSVMHASTLEAPFYLMFGREPQMPAFLWKKTNLPVDAWEISKIKEIPVEDLREEILARLQIAWDLARESIRKAQEKQKRWYDENAKKLSFRLGDRVWLAVPQFRKSTNLENATAIKKFAAKWTGPHRVVGVSEDQLTYKLMELISPLEVIYRTAHLRRMRPYTTRSPVSPAEESLQLSEEHALEEELAIAKKARVLRKMPFRPRAYGISKELKKRGIDPDNDSEGSEEDEADKWEVEKIVRHSDKGEDGERSFFVKWKHHNAAHNSWVDLSDMSAPQLLRDYYVKHRLGLDELDRFDRFDRSVTRRSERLKRGREL
jgi:hypothetical protein